MADFSLQALHDEIEADPQGLGYKEAGGAWKGDQEIADLLNDPVNGAVIQREHITPQEIIQQIAIADWDGMSGGDRLYIAMLPALSEVSVKPNGSEVRANLIDIFGPASATRANLLAIIERQGSRAEVLWGEGTNISASNVGHAANL